MRPAVGCSRSSTSFAVVVLPQPDSPTRPSVLPGSMVNEMSSTALTTAVARAKSPRRTGKCLVRFFASRTGPAMLAGKPAAAGMSVGHDAEVVGDEDEREAVRALEVAQEVQVLRLDREIEAGRRLVGDEQARLARDRDRPDDALAHPARELMGILAHARLGRRDADRLQQLLRPAPGAAPARAIVDPDRLGDLVAPPEERGQRRHRVLQGHGDAPAAGPAPPRG